MPSEEGHKNLIPFKKGDGRPRPHVGRPHALSDPEYAQHVAALFVAGSTRTEMAEILEVNEATITRWRKDPRIKAAALPLIEDRVVQITRRVDSEIEGRLQKPGELTVKELLEIRKEFLAGTLRQQQEKLDEGTVSEAMQAIEKDPELINKLLDLLNNAPVTPPDGGLITEEQAGISTDALGD